jgi:hypothetical protein
MRSEIVPGVFFPDYELTDHTAKRRKLSEWQGPHPIVLVLSRGGFRPKDRRLDTISTSTTLLVLGPPKPYVQTLGEQD